MDAYLRRFKAEDLEAFQAYRSDSEVGRFQSWSKMSTDVARDFIKEQKEAHFGVPGEWLQVAIALSATDCLIGDLGILTSDSESRAATIGFAVAREHQGKGYGREAVQQILKVLFGVAGMKTVEGITDSRNQPSIKLLKSVGMEKQREERVVINDEICLDYVFSISNTEWQIRNAV